MTCIGRVACGIAIVHDRDIHICNKCNCSVVNAALDNFWTLAGNSDYICKSFRENESVRSCFDLPVAGGYAVDGEFCLECYGASDSVLVFVACVC